MSKLLIPDRTALEQCLKCNICTTFCPVATLDDGFPGPKAAGPDYLRLSLSFVDTDVDFSLCTNCQLCNWACPHGVDIATMNVKAKAQSKKNFRDWVLTNPQLIGKVASKMSTLTNLFANNLIGRVIKKALRIAPERKLPLYHKQTFLEWFDSKKQLDYQEKVVYFAGCSVIYNDPDLGKAVIEVYNRNGIGVIVPEQGCCGVPALANGRIDQARKTAEKTLEQLKPYTDQGYAVITACTSCGLALKDEWHRVLNLPRAKDFANSVYDASEYLMLLEQKGELNQDLGPIQKSFGYHEPCHLKAQGIGKPSVQLLRKIPELEVNELDAGCCGMAGTYGFKKENYERSLTIGDELFRKIDNEYEEVLTDCPTCTMQINQATKANTVHPLVLLRDAYKRGESSWE